VHSADGTSGADTQLFGAPHLEPRPDGAPAIDPDVQARLEAELLRLASLASSSGEVRSRRETAAQAIGILKGATGARFGAIAIIVDDRWSLLATSDTLALPADAVERIRIEDSSIARVIAPPGRIVAGEPHATPLLTPIADALVAAGINWLIVTALRAHDAILGVVVLGWASRPTDTPPDAAILQAAAQVSAALENARLVEELGLRIVAERGLSARLEGLAEQYEAMFRDSPDALVLVRHDQTIVDLNERAVTLLGGGREDWLGRPAGRMTDATPDEREQRARLATMSQRVTYGTIGVRLDGTRFPMEATTARLSAGASMDASDSRTGGEASPAAGESGRLLIHFRDLTDEQRLQSELIQAQKMEAVGQLVAGVAHELNNPLAAIIGFSQIIRGHAGLPEEMHHDADMLIQESMRTKKIVESLLNFARQRPPERHPTRLRTLVDSVLELESYEFATDAIRSVVDIPGDLPPVPLDRSQMQQVILNLVQNAIQAIRAWRGTGTITITAAERRAADGTRIVRLAVADDGPGVAEANRDRLFLPFFTTKEPGSGTGLGLSVSFGIVAGHGGRLTFAPGEAGGSIFTVELPLDPASDGEDGPAAARSDPMSGEPARESGSSEPIRVLVLDDEPAIRVFLDRVLQAAGMEVTLAADGREALRLIEDGLFDAVLCDHRMAGMTGIEVYETVARLRPELTARFVVMSGDVLNPELRTFAAERDIHLLAKPFDVETILSVIRAVLARPTGLPVARRRNRRAGRSRVGGARRDQRS
jgi:PAS domain S-box-containing protein